MSPTTIHCTIKDFVVLFSLIVIYTKPHVSHVEDLSCSSTTSNVFFCVDITAVYCTINIWGHNQVTIETTASLPPALGLHA